MTGQPVTRPADAAALASEALAAFGRVTLRLSGTSMLPALQPGDVVEFRAITLRQAQAGDIVLVRGGAGLVSHRVVACTPDVLITQGDALGSRDQAIAHADVLGRGVGLTRRARVLDWSRASATPRPLTRWWFRRFDLATRLWLRWHRLASRRAA